MPSIEQVLEKQKELGSSFEEFKKENDSRLEKLEKSGHVPGDVEEKVSRAIDDVTKLNADFAELQKQFNRDNFTDKIQGEKAAEKTDRYAKYIRGAEYNDRTAKEYKSLFFNEKGQWDSEKEDTYRKAFSHYMRTEDKTLLHAVLRDNGLSPQDAKSMNVINDNAGGFLVSPVMGEMITHTITEFSPMHELVDSVEIVADSIQWPTTDYSAGASRAHELGSRGETTAPTFGEVQVKPEDLYAAPRVSQRMLDLRPDLESWLSELIAFELRVTEANEMLNGTNPLECRGILTYASGTSNGQIEQVDSGHATLIDDADKIKDLHSKLKKAYRAGAVFQAERATFNSIGQLKDGQGQYLWQPGLELGRPMNLLGFPAIESEDMPSIGASALALAFGNFKRAYKFVTMPGIRILRDPYSNKPYVELHTTRRSGGAVVVSEAIKLLKVSA